MQKNNLGIAIKNAVIHLKRPDGEEASTLSLKAIGSDDSQKKVKARFESAESVKRLEEVLKFSPWSSSGKTNLSFIEHFCDLRNSAAKAAPAYMPTPSEGHTALLAPLRDFTQGVIHNEIQLLDAMLEDIQQAGVSSGVEDRTVSEMSRISSVLKVGRLSHLIAKTHRRE